MEIQSFTFNPFLENTFVVSDETGEAIIIDPGCYEAYEKEQLQQYITDHNLTVKSLINTHGHIDHVFGNHFVRETWKVPLYMHKKDEETLRAVEAYAPSYGFRNYEPSAPDHFLEEGNRVSFGNSVLDVLFVPGHAPGHIALVNRNERVCLSGDVLFDGSVGRSDLPGGDHDTLIKSIREKLFLLPDETVVYCGHGPSTTIGKEKISNPFAALV